MTAKPKTKHTPIGELPAEWECKPLDALGDIVRGASPRPAGSPKYFDGDFIPWITVADITGAQGLFLQGTKSRLTEEGAEYSRIFPANTLLLTNSGATLGVPKITTFAACANDGVAGFLELSADVDVAFLFYCLARLTGYFRQSLAPGVGQPNLNTDLIGGVRVPLPPLPEQRKVAEILSTWDRAIEQTEKLIAAKQRLKKGLMQQLLTGKLRFPQFRGTPWRTCRLGDLFSERIETDRTDLPLLSITGDRGVIPREALDKRDTSSEDKSAYKRIAPGDVGYNTMRMWQGVSAVSSLEGIVSPAYTVAVPKPDIYADFAGHLLKFASVVHLLWRHSQGLVDDTLSLKYPNFARIKVTIPGVHEQRLVTCLLKTCDSEIGLLQQRQTALQQQKKGLMQKLLTGKVRVHAGS